MLALLSLFVCVALLYMRAVYMSVLRSIKEVHR